MSKTLIVLNPHAAGGRAGKIWNKLEPALWNKLGELVIAVTQRPEEVAQHLDSAYQAGLTRVISIGGDGTNHALINALAEHNEKYPDGPPMVYGTLPIGTGRDWARTVGIPFDIEKAADWIAHAEPKAVDIGLLTIDSRREYFLNIASVGMGGDVAERVNRVQQRRPWTFIAATVATLLQYRPPVMKIELDEQVWYEGPAFAVAVANGRSFGHGMKVAPHAEISDGLFDVILVEGMSRLEALPTLRLLYDGSHLKHPKVRFERAKQVVLVGHQQKRHLELDGEFASGYDIRFEIKPGLLHLLA